MDRATSSRIVQKHLFQAGTAAIFFLLAISDPANAAPSKNVSLELDPANVNTAQETINKAIKLAEETDISVEIYAPPGVYSEQNFHIRWPSHLRGLTIRGNRDKTVFDGRSNTDTWLDIAASGGRNTNIVVRDITVRHYLTAISIAGSREKPDTGWNGNNIITQTTFEDIGARGTTAPSTAVIRLVTSSSNKITDNIFKEVYNETTCGLIHVVYLAHSSSNNLVENNVISTRCMDPFRIRDSSNNNLFANNTVTGRIPSALYTEWYCKSDCTKKAPECPSNGNSFIDHGKTIQMDQDRPPLFEVIAPAGPVPVGCTSSLSPRH